MNRTPQEIIEHHAKALRRGDVADVMSDYSDDARFITEDGVVAGRAALTETFTAVLDAFPKFDLTVESLVAEGNVALLLWSADTVGHTIIDGVDTFVVRDGLIHAQTAKFTARPKSGGADA